MAVSVYVAAGEASAASAKISIGEEHRAWHAVAAPIISMA